MLKTRIIPTLLHRDAGLVKGAGFDNWRPVGGAMQAVKVYNLRGVDELVFFDIAATAENRPPDFALIDALADECFMPLTVGGGVATLEHARGLLAVGADKVCFGTAAFESPGLVEAASRRFGAQCVVAAIDVRGGEVYNRCGTRPTGLSPADAARRMEAAGAGELLVQSIERDGTMRGYDLESLRAVSEAVRIPVVASGGCGEFADMAEAIEHGASAVAAASLFHFTEHTPLEAKRFLAGRGVPVRL